MTSVLDLWRAVDASAAMVSGDERQLQHAVRGVARTRALAPHLPPSLEGQLLAVDARIVPTEPLEPLIAALAEAGEPPVALLLAGSDARHERIEAPYPVLSSRLPAATVAEVAQRYLGDEPGFLDELMRSLRLAAAEAALADPTVGAPAGLVAARLRRGVAVEAGGRLVALHARPAGTALAARFSAAHARTSSAGATTRSGVTRHTRDGLWLREERIRPDAAVWLFDDLPFGAVDVVAAQALTITLRALLSRPAVGRREAPRRAVPSSGEPLMDTLVAVARANGRVAAAARSLGVHRNTVLYRLRRASVELGIDPRRPDDALRLLRRASGERD